MLKNTVFLTNTDTTIGFLSQNKEKLNNIKKRLPHKSYIKAVNSLKTLQKFTRVPTKYKNRVRKAKKTSFIFPNGNSYRIIKDTQHLLLLNRLKWAYTTSANISGEAYNEKFSRKNADIIIEPLHNNNTPSTIYKINLTSIKKVR